MEKNIFKKGPIIGLVIIFLFFFYGVTVSKTYYIDFKPVKCEETKKSRFKYKFINHISRMGFRQVEKQPEWAARIFSSDSQYNCFVHDEHIDYKAIFYWFEREDGSVDIFYQYLVSGNPVLINDKIELCHNTGKAIATKFPELQIDKH